MLAVTTLISNENMVTPERSYYETTANNYFPHKITSEMVAIIFRFLHSEYDIVISYFNLDFNNERISFQAKLV